MRLRMKLVCLAVAAAAGMLGGSVLSATAQIVESMVEQLRLQGVSADSIRGYDESGIPIVCGSISESSTEVLAAKGNPHDPPPDPPPYTLLPAGFRCWELVPGVIRADGVDSSRLEVDVNGNVAEVFLTKYTSDLVFASGPNTQSLRDDGLSGDRVAGDHIFTSESILFNTNKTLSFLIGPDINSPAGLGFKEIGELSVVETNGVTNFFLISPVIGLLRSDVPEVSTAYLATNIQASEHLLNVLTSNRYTQISMRYVGQLAGLTYPTYSVFPDAFDFFMLFSTDHIEKVPYNSSVNFAAGDHWTVQVNYTGTGQNTLSVASSYGSAGRLLGINILDTASRGIYGNNVVHELLHQWSSFTSTSLGLATGDGHYRTECSAGSLVGGGFWSDNGDGTYTRACSDNIGPSDASPLDKYMMGLIEATNVPPLWVFESLGYCNDPQSNLLQTVTVQDIQAIHGVRSPGPATARKDFSIAFVAESFNRPLNATEMTFYETLAAHFTKPIPPEEPAPGIKFGWVPITRYFGEGSTWSSEVLPLIRPSISGLAAGPNGAVSISGSGCPGKVYDLLRTTDFTTWAVVTNATANTNGTFILRDEAGSSSPSPSFYRAALH